MPDTCRLGGWCRLAGVSPGPDAGRGLCLSCEEYAPWAIGQIPPSWQKLELLKVPYRSGVGKVGGLGKPAEPPLPLREWVDAVGREVVWTLEMWAEPVAEQVGVAPSGGGTAAQHQWQLRRRAPHTVRWATELLTRHFSVLLALPATAHLPYHSREPAEADGPAAVAQLVGLHRQLTLLVGEAPVRQPRPGNCLRCGAARLLWEVGTEQITCGACGYALSGLDYTRYVQLMLAELTAAV